PEPLAIAGGQVAYLHEADKLLRNVAKALIGLRCKRRRRTPIAGAGVVEERAVIPEVAEGAAELDGQAVAAGEVHVPEGLLRDVVAVLILIVEEAGLIVLKAAQKQVAEDVAARGARGHEKQGIAISAELRAVI